MGREKKTKLTKINIFKIKLPTFNRKGKKDMLICGYKLALAKHIVDDNQGQKGSEMEKTGTRRKAQEKQRQQNTRADAKVE